MLDYFFGTKTDQVFPDKDKLYWVTLSTIVKIEPFKTLAATHHFQNILFPHQMHGTTGLIVKHDIHSIPKSFTIDADWIITNVPGLAIGILTADCVPLLLHDPVSLTVCAIHAGWRGATDGIVLNAIENMKQHFDVQTKNVQVYIGPHARTCCYQIDALFYDIVIQKAWGSSAWYKKDNQLFFDLYACCMEQLNCAGISTAQIRDDTICTVCNINYCSYRRDKEQAGRNISMIGIL